VASGDLIVFKTDSYCGMMPSTRLDS